MKLLYKAAYTFFTVVLIAVGGLLVSTMVPVPGNIEVKIVQSGSMEPSIPVGSLVVIHEQASYAVGDVITFGEDTKEKVPTTHRIVGSFEENGAVTYMTKGDANEEPDPAPVSRSSIIGQVVAHVPYVGYILDFARTPWGFALLVGLPALLVIIEEALNIYREVKRRWFPSGNGTARSVQHITHTHAESETVQQPNASPRYEADPRWYRRVPKARMDGIVR